MPIQQLRELAAAGVLTRRDYQRMPPMVDYTMTAFGMTLAGADAAVRVGTGNRSRVAEIMRSGPFERDESLPDAPALQRSMRA